MSNAKSVVVQVETVTQQSAQVETAITPKLPQLITELTGLNWLELIQLWGWIKENEEMLQERIQYDTSNKIASLLEGAPVIPNMESITGNVALKVVGLLGLLTPWVGEKAVKEMVGEVEKLDAAYLEVFVVNLLKGSLESNVGKKINEVKTSIKKATKSDKPKTVRLW